METFSPSLAFCAWNSPSQKPVTRSLDIFFDLNLNKRLSNAGDLRRHRAHDDGKPGYILFFDNGWSHETTMFLSRSMQINQDTSNQITHWNRTARMIYWLSCISFRQTRLWYRYVANLLSESILLGKIDHLQNMYLLNFVIVVMTTALLGAHNIPFLHSTCISGNAPIRVLKYRFWSPRGSFQHDDNALAM